MLGKMEEKHHIVKNWKTFKKLLNNTNVNTSTLIMSGFVNKFKETDGIITLELKKVFFKKVPIEILKNGKEKDEKEIL